VVGESQDGGDQVSSVREESQGSSPSSSSEESSEMQEAIILSDNEGMGVQQAVKRKSSSQVEEFKRPRKQEKPKVSPSGKMRTKVEDPYHPIYSAKRLLINVKVPARVENPEKVIDLLGGQAHLTKVIINTIISCRQFKTLTTKPPSFSRGQLTKTRRTITRNFITKALRIA
jgi:hypothetical protein